MFRKKLFLLLLCLFCTVCAARAAVVDTVGVGEQGVQYKVPYKSGSTYQWKVTGGIIVAGNGGYSVLIDWGKKYGYYEVSVVETSRYGCVGDTIKQIVYLALPKFPIIRGKEKICLGETISLEASGPDSLNKDLSYRWVTGETTQVIIITPLISATYFCIVYYNGDAVDTAFIDVIVYTIPKPSLAWMPIKPKVGDEIQINYTGENYHLISWMLNGEKDSTQAPKLFRLVDSIGQIEVIVNVENELGCSKEIKRIIYIEGDSELLIPEVFSPNSDGINDLYIVDFPLGMQRIDLKIYNRWGNLVLNSSDSHFEWDGKMNGSDLPSGAYLITIEAYNSAGKFITYDGTISIIQ